MPVSSARSVCLAALCQWERRRDFADDILHEHLERTRLPPVERAFLTEVFYGILRNLAALDFIIAKLGRTNLDDETRQLLRLGFYQVFHMRIPDHAAVNETVELAGRARSVVNALLRRSLRERPELEKAMAEASIAIRHSHPEFLVHRWSAKFGAENTLKLCEWNNTPPSIYVCANTLKVTAGELLRASPDSELCEFHPLALKVHQIPFLWIANGLCYIQDPSTLVAPDLLDCKPAQTVLDTCAAPGGKAGYMAALMQNSGKLVACDSSPNRLHRLKENLTRLGVTNAIIVQHDFAATPATLKPETFDRILVDAPCTNTGVIRRRIDVRWRLRPEDFDRMAQRQFQIVESAAPLLKPGGSLVYSTCSLEPEENEGVTERVAAEISGLKLVTTKQTLPFHDGVDGAFAALFKKA